jgi:hypothetical protein
MDKMIIYYILYHLKNKTMSNKNKLKYKMLKKKLANKKWVGVVKESYFQSQVIMLAKLHGWLVMHTRAVEIRPGVWKTPLQGHAGFPDLVLVHPDRGLIFAELKSDKGKLSAMQIVWSEALTIAGQEVYLWRPKDIQDISTRLARKPN